MHYDARRWELGAPFGGFPASPTSFVAPIVDLASANPGADIERSACVSVAIRPGVAYECGDLRLAYGLPAIRVFNQTRSVTLLYNSQHAKPTPIVRAWVTLPVGGAQPDSVIVTVWINSMARKTQSWPTSTWAAGEQRQVALSFDAADLTTNLYRYLLEVSFTYGTGRAMTQTYGDLAVVNRSTSEFGRGWWVSGYERVVPQQNGDVFWVGGDGSTRLYAYKYVGANGRSVYKARTLAGSDSLTYSPSGSGSWFRHLPRGAYVRFDATGRHELTSSTTGQLTNFLTYFGCARLVLIQLATPSTYTAFRGYTFNYDKDASPTPCVGQALHRNSGASDSAASTWRITERYEDADGGSFYHSATAATVSYALTNGRVSTWTDVRGTETTLVYGTDGLLTSARTPTGVASDSVIRQFRAGEGAALAGPDVATELYTKLYSPRWPAITALTKVWLGPWGNPQTIIDPLGRTTSILPNPTFPLLADRVTNPAGWSQYALYNSYGNLTYMNADPVGGTGTPEWYYYYDAANPDNLTRTVDPTGLVTNFGYINIGAQYPLLSWQQVSDNTSRRTDFEYCLAANCFGLPRITVGPANARGVRSRDSVSYDSLGNLARTLSHDGKCAEFLNDGIGRVVVSRERYSGSCRTPPTPPGGGGGGGACPPYCQLSTPVNELGWVTTTNLYDALDRIIATTTIAPADGASPEQRLQTRTSYAGFSSLVTRARRWSEPDSVVGVLSDSMRYDAIGRVTWKLAQGTRKPETYAYDSASNLTLRVTARGDTLKQGYDALNRLAYRVTPQVSFPAETLGTALLTQSDTTLTPSFPRLPLGVAARTIDRDSASFTYDLTGQVWTANNKDARITRLYLPNGALQSETQSLRAVSSNTFGQHIYTLSYGYDRAGRRTTLTHPSQLAPGTGVESWTYNTAQDGLPMSVQPPLGGPITFEFDLAGQLSAQVVPGGIRRELLYFPDGEIDSDVLRNLATAAAVPLPNTGGVARSAFHAYDIRGKLMHLNNTVGLHEDLLTTFSPMGHLRTSVYSTSYYTIFGSLGSFSSKDSSLADAFGNSRSGSTRATENVSGSYGGGGVTSTTQFTYSQYRSDSTGQLQQSQVGPTNSYVVNDSAGNVTQQRTPGRWPVPGLAGVPVSERVMYYDAANKLTAVDARKGPVPGADAFASPDFLLTFDAYRYDALGRRVWVQSSRRCPTSPPATYWVDCQLGSVRRVVWDGERELYEIKMPNVATYWDNDIQPLDTVTVGVATQPNGSEQYDRSPHYGRVGYVYGGAIDRPLVVMRVGYGDNPAANFPNRKGYKAFAAFPLYPQWDLRGEPALGSTSDGGLWPCEGTGALRRCTYPIAWSGLWSPNSMSTGKFYMAWSGSLLEDKREATGLLYRRNRFLDATTGRFTQPDPIGLAGGLNAYGYASGDPVSFSDPFGLCPGVPGTAFFSISDCPPGYFQGAAAVAGGITGYFIGKGIGGTGGGAGGELVCAGVPVCGVAGAVVGQRIGGRVGIRAGAAVGGEIGELIDGAVLLSKKKDIQQVDAAIRKALGRKPTDDERGDFRDYIHSVKGGGPDFPSFKKLVELAKELFRIEP